MWSWRKPTFKDLAIEILEQKQIIRAPTTYASAKVRFDRLIDHFGDTSLSEITESKWQKYVSERMKKKPGCKFFDDKKYMRQVMLEAHRRGIIQRTFRLPIPDVPGTVGREISEAEKVKLFQHAPEKLRFQMDIARLMGLRKKELLHLTWDQINWERQTISFSPANVKTRRGREVPINPDLITRFRHRFLERKSRYVFPAPKNAARPELIRRAWIRCKKKAGVDARWHDWRHTCATVMLRLGNSVEAVKRYLGMSAKVLTRIYNHLNIDDMRRVATTMSGTGGASKTQ